MILNDSRPEFLARPKPKGGVPSEAEAGSRQATAGGRSDEPSPTHPSGQIHRSTKLHKLRPLPLPEPGEGCCFLISVTGSLRAEARLEKHVRLAEQW